ncbi:hypothetical protein [Novosphingobium sp. CECT 9465]|uniref:hypothetical protein n=1 Tax=Novosphingobium sp. CECT 9465 TaxID=2829794 RepID=UPI001E3D1060|nr:hypothetical protein [Novosphingobium sp. CECT 9465]CAH0496615.1 hypothetical protein NVSP9465_01652 [Novosphingobium sp. CECT 9465]
MMDSKVHLFDLRERISASGNRYLSGWLGKASVVAFLDREAEEPTWQVYVSQPKQDGASRRAPRHARAERPPRASRLAPGELDDDISDIGGR